MTLTGAAFLLDLPSSKVTADLIKEQLDKLIGFPKSKITLVFRGKELVGADLEQKSILKMYPDYSSRDFFVIMYRKIGSMVGFRSKKRSASNELSAKGSKQQKSASSSSGQAKKSKGEAENSGEGADSKSSGTQHLSNLQEMRDFLRKFGERRQARTQSRSLEPKEELLSQLTNMGFKKEAATRALLLNRNNLEMALNWLLENSNDPEINKPISAKERQQLSRMASRPAIPMEALNDFIEINFGRGQSPAGESSANQPIDSEESVEDAAAGGGSRQRAAEATDSDNEPDGR
eukprot:CAMPEP_0184493140 /NCGR_PEP_ID=MMETSP0113_2-20130426/25203_1 /TAXON_ID=91329 /ORGANISM="Norrisiella sphaerica, Strain BC52" /LENGTH=290 /DNA_ID=CAMNT_0026878287 /DNA_START=81 /DNA_END=953 /DNA_ORIENTATION=-